MVAKPGRPEAEARARAAELEARHGGLAPMAVVEKAARALFAGEIAAVSSFGADSAVLLHMLAAVDPTVPVLFLDTDKHFSETIAYRDLLADDLGLADLRVITPREDLLAARDQDGTLHRRDTDACCDIRKVEPMARAVAPFAAWLTGRKRFQASSRAGLPVFEAVGTRIRINPLASWTTHDLAAYMRANDLRENPLTAYGYLSIGCFPCTQPVKPGEDARSGRWAGSAKTECGIHLPGMSAAAPRIRG